MTRRQTTEDDLQPATEEAAQSWLIEFSHWRFIRPAWVRRDGTDPRQLMPTAETAEYFGTMLCKKFSKALHEKFLGKNDPERLDDPAYLRQRARVREALEEVPKPESWLDAWPAFWDFFTKERKQSAPRLDPLFKEWPMMDEEAVGEIMEAWEKAGRADSLQTFAALAQLGVNVPRTVCRMKARLNLPFKELAAEWCKNLGLASQLESGVQTRSMEAKKSLSGAEDDGQTLGDTLADERGGDGSAHAGIADLRELLKLLPKAVFDEMTPKERAIVSLRLFQVPTYRPPVSDCAHIEPPRGYDALYRTFNDVVTLIQAKAQQVVSDPVVKNLRPSGSGKNDGTSLLVAAILDEEIRRILCAWLGHSEGDGVKLSERAPDWLLAMLSSVKPHWPTMNTPALMTL